ncbi:MAG TPA: hemerythrin family protein [Azospirillum sp.]|nr:hemerythrin family protein [Azospirillum sp.]
MSVSMADLEWNEAYGIGVPELDADLRRLHDLYCAIRASLEGGGAIGGVSADLRAVCAELIDTARGHFAREERLMEAYDYPDRAAHAKLHQSFLEQVEDVWTFVRDDGARDDYMARFLVLGFIGKWLKMHIMVVDQKFGEFLVLRGHNGGRA